MTDSFDFICPLSYRDAGFHDGRHLMNFLKYLLSMSKNHPQNDQTNLNYVRLSGEEVGGLERANAETLKSLEDAVKKGGEYQDFTNDLAYWAFAVRVGDRAISNFAVVGAADEEMIRVDPEIYKDLCQVLPAEKVQDHLIGLFKACGQIVSFADASREERLTIETQIDEALRAEDEPEVSVFIHVSHNDQDSAYHTHRLLIESQE